MHTAAAGVLTTRTHRYGGQLLLCATADTAACPPHGVRDACTVSHGRPVFGARSGCSCGVALQIAPADHYNAHH